MKKTGAFIAGLFLSLAGMAQENKGGISDFMKEEIADFDKFMDCLLYTSPSPRD